MTQARICQYKKWLHYDPLYRRSHFTFSGKNAAGAVLGRMAQGLCAVTVRRLSFWEPHTLTEVHLSKYILRNGTPLARNVMLRFRHILPACLAWLALAPSARAECAKWDINGEWEFAKSDGLDTTFHLRQDGDQLTGAASYKSLTGGNSRGTSQSLEGIFDQYGNLRIAVKWDSGAR